MSPTPANEADDARVRTVYVPSLVDYDQAMWNACWLCVNRRKVTIREPLSPSSAKLKVKVVVRRTQRALCCTASSNKTLTVIRAQTICIEKTKIVEGNQTGTKTKVVDFNLR